MKISIVTPSFNQLHYLRQTAASVLGQQGPFELEWIVVDDGSTDGSLAYLQSLEREDPRLRLFSQANHGQTHALNQALARVRGDVVGWINGDDLFTDGALARVARAFEHAPHADWLIGGCTLIDDAGREVRRRITAYKNFGLRRYSFRRLLRENFISQPAVFWRAGLMQRVGARMEAGLVYAFDYELWLRFGQTGDPLMLPEPLAQFRVHRQSKSGQINRLQFDEQYEVACRYLGRRWLSRAIHRFNVEKIVFSYRTMRRLGVG